MHEAQETIPRDPARGAPACRHRVRLKGNPGAAPSVGRLTLDREQSRRPAPQDRWGEGCGPERLPAIAIVRGHTPLAAGPPCRGPYTADCAPGVGLGHRTGNIRWAGPHGLCPQGGLVRRVRTACTRRLQTHALLFGEGTGLQFGTFMPRNRESQQKNCQTGPVPISPADT